MLIIVQEAPLAARQTGQDRDPPLGRLCPFMEIPVMNQARIAIPSTLPGGLEAQVGSPLRPLRDLHGGGREGSLITQVGTLPSVPHEQGGCLAAVNHLAQARRDRAHRRRHGHAAPDGLQPGGHRGLSAATAAPSVEAAVKALIKGELERFTREFTCGGGQQLAGARTP